MTLDHDRNIGFLFKSLRGKVDLSFAKFRELRRVEAKSDMREHDPFDLDDLGNLFDDFFDDDFFYGNLDNLNHLLRRLRRGGHLCRRWRFLQWDSGGNSIIRVWPRTGDYRRVRVVTEEGFRWRTAAHNKMERSKNQPLRNEPRRIQQVSGNPKGIRLAIVVLVRRSDAKFWPKDEIEGHNEH